MRLLARLLIGIAAIVVVCLVLSAGLILRDTHARIETATTASADRAAKVLAALYWQELVWRDGLNRAELLPLPEWRALGTAQVVAPGICVAFRSPRVMAPTPLCSAAESDYAPSPAWFDALYRDFYGAFTEARRPIDARQNVGEIVAGADPGTALRLAWLELGLMLRVAVTLALAIGLGIALFVARTLMPVRGIVAQLRRLESGDYAMSLEKAAGAELGEIVRAVDALAARLAHSHAARAALTRRLFQVQEDERRALAPRPARRVRPVPRRDQRARRLDRGRRIRSSRSRRRRPRHRRCDAADDGGLEGGAGASALRGHRRDRSRGLSARARRAGCYRPCRQYSRPARGRGRPRESAAAYRRRALPYRPGMPDQRAAPRRRAQHRRASGCRRGRRGRAQRRG